MKCEMYRRTVIFLNIINNDIMFRRRDAFYSVKQMCVINTNGQKVVDKQSE